MNQTLQAAFDRIQRPALGVGAIALAISAVGALLSPTQFVRSYMVAFWFWLMPALGCLAVLMIQYFIKGKWGLLIRRPLEAGTRTLPLMAVLFLPILFSLSRIYLWARPETVASLHLEHFKQEYLTAPFWVARAVVYFALLLLWAYLLNRWSSREDAAGGSRPLDRMRYLSGPGLVLFSFIVTFAAIDWIMSLDPGFFSTIYGLIFVVIPARMGVALAVIVLMLLSKYEPFTSLAEPKRFNDYGNLLLVFTMLWAYLQFDQFLIIWAGNLQDEIPWYVIRAKGSWGGVALSLFILNFALPFMLLLQRAVTQRMRWLAGLSVTILIMEWVDLYWMISPSFFPQGPRLSWMDLTLFAGIGGVWVAYFVAQLKKRPLMPLHDPRFEGVITVGS
ncbi:MAG TPA: hypothetical protein VI455_10150 [Terriglobia bacterium]